MGNEPEIGSILEGKVTTITKFGAFVALEAGGSGLVHISEIANTFVNDVHDFLQEGQSVKVKVLASSNGKINLSIKKALPPEERPARAGGPHPASRPAPRFGQPRPAAGGQALAQPQPAPLSANAEFEEKLKKFLSASEGKIADLNRSTDGRRCGRRRR